MATTKEVQQNIIDDYLSGMYVNEVAKGNNVSYATIYNVLKRNNINKRGHSFLVNDNSPFWKGGKTINEGYVRVKSGVGRNKKYRLEHRLVMEEFLGRPLTSK